MANSAGWKQQVAPVSKNPGVAAGHNRPSGTYSASKPMGSLADNLAKVWGTHTFKAGFYAEYYANLEPAGPASNGTITVDATSASRSGDAYAHFLLGRGFGVFQRDF